MARVGGMDGKPDRGKRGEQPAQGCGGEKRGGFPERRARRPGDDRAAAQDAAARGMPDPQMIFGQFEAGLRQGVARAVAVQPGRRDESGGGVPLIIQN